MEIEKGKEYYGFKLLDIEKISEIESTVMIFEHIKSGARLINLENNDDNKLFSIGFRTTPTDSTGVAHILEHSVLCGSKKFKTKDPFSDMAKSSLHTFMNAMTYTDKTIYPVGSKNKKDFMNLINVYLDAVLHPRIYENHNILKQEGWRYEFDEDDRLTIKGVVYSEMQGALSSPEETIINNIYGSLFPNTTYENVSGGDPEVIPELTQEEFEKFHSKFYHPTNCYIYLYGNGNIDEYLKFIDEEYLREFDRIEVPSSIEFTKPFNKMTNIREVYSINEDEDEENKEFLALSFAYERTDDALAYLTHKVLYYIFIESSASPIKRALLDNKIGESLVTGDDMNMDPTKELLMPIVVKNVAKGQEDKFKNVIFDTLQKLVNDGIDKELMKAAINTLEFQLREITPYKGLEYNELVLQSWIYDGEPTALLKFDENLKQLKEHINDGYFERFIKKNMIDNKHCSFVVLSPKKGLAAKKAKELKQKLENYKLSLSKEEINKIIEENKKLKEEQLKKDSEEDKKTIPKLDVSEIERNVEKIPQKVLKQKDITILQHEIFTGKIEYINLLFDARNIIKEDIRYLSLLTDLLGKLDTKSRKYSDLITEVSKVTGGIEFYVDVYSKSNSYESCIPKLKVTSKTVVSNIKETVMLLNEIIRNTKFNDVDRIHEVIKEIKANLQLSILDNGNVFAIDRVYSMFSLSGAYREELEGASYYKFICELDRNYQNDKYRISKKLEGIYQRIFNVNNLIISLIGDNEDNNNVIDNINLLLNGLKNTNISSELINNTKKSESVGLITGSNVQYVVKGYNISKLGYEYSGKMLVMNNILDSEYFYPMVRLQGGAYGCYSFLSRSGNIGVYSYRDPNIKKTLEVYSDAYKFLETLELSDRDMDNFIIGTIGRTFRTLTPMMKGEKAVMDYICGITYEDNQKVKDEILDTSLNDIKSFAGMIKKVMEQNTCCVVGNKENIEQSKEVFDCIENM